MSMRCDICGKKSVTGRSQRHGRGVAGKRWKNRAQKTVKGFRPNLRLAVIEVGGVRKRVKICAKCLKRYKKDRKDASLSVASA